MAVSKLAWKCDLNSSDASRSLAMLQLRGTTTFHHVAVRRQ
jgi:hypothetical protein